MNLRKLTVKKSILVVHTLFIFYFLNRICHAYLYGIVRPKSSTRSSSFNRSTITKGSTCPRDHRECNKALLYSMKNENKENINKKERVVGEYRNFGDRLSLIDSSLIYTDIFAIVIACQLMGLIDVLNNPIFWKNGGWIQPILVTDSSSTLPIFLQRVAVNSVSYICTTFFFVAGAYQIDCALQTPQSLRRTMKSSIIIFTTVRLGIWIGIILLTQQSSIEYNDNILEKVVNPWDGFSELLRECYFVATATSAGRLVLFKFFK